MQPEIPPLQVMELAELWGVSHVATHKFLRNHGIATSNRRGKAVLAADDARKAVLARGLKFPRQTITVQMLKGGVGKTTAAFNIGMRASIYGARVLLVDLDQQANLTFTLGMEGMAKVVWADILDGANIKDAILEVSPNLHLIPSSLRNSVVDRLLLTGKRNIGTAVSSPLQEVRDNYDLIIIDTAPSFSSINTAATVAADRILLPVAPDKLSLDGLKMTLEDIEGIRKEFDASYDTRILFGSFDPRTVISHETLKQCIVEYGDIMLRGFIRLTTEIPSSTRSGKTIFHKKGPAKQDYDVATREILGLAADANN